LKYELDKTALLIALNSYRNSMTEFDPEEMDYLIDLVDRDIELENNIKV
jgi:hypothetical protein